MTQISQPTFDSTATKLLQLDDLNTIIKYFSNEILKRLLELQNYHREHERKSDTKLGKNSQQKHKNIEENDRKQLENQHQQKQGLNNDNNYQLFKEVEKLTKNCHKLICYQNKQDQQLKQSVHSIIDKYCQLKLIEGQIQYEYTKKMVQRVLQIFGYYKWKCRNQSILNHVQRQITTKLNLLIGQTPIDVSKVLNYVVEICQKGFIAHPHLTFKMGRKNSQSLSLRRRKTIQQECIAISRLKQKPSSSTNTLDQISIENTTKIESTCKSAFNRKRRTVSVMSCIVGSNPNADIFEKLYGCMKIDKNYMAKLMDSEGYLARDQLKRNKSILKKIQSQQLSNKKSLARQNSNRKLKISQIQVSSMQALRQVKTNVKMSTHSNFYSTFSSTSSKLFSNSHSNTNSNASRQTNLNTSSRHSQASSFKPTISSKTGLILSTPSKQNKQKPSSFYCSYQNFMHAEIQNQIQQERAQPLPIGVLNRRKYKAKKSCLKRNKFGRCEVNNQNNFI